MAMRRSERVWWLSVLAMASTLLWSVTVLAQESIGQVASLQGQATVQPAGSSQVMPLSVQSPVYRDDTIQTLEVSKIKLLLIDGTELTLGEGGTMTLSQLVYAPQHNTHQGIVRIARGLFGAVTRAKCCPRWPLKCARPRQSPRSVAHSGSERSLRKRRLSSCYRGKSPSSRLIDVSVARSC